MKPCSSLKIHQITFKALSILTLCIVDTIQLIHCNFTKKEEKKSISNSGISLALYVHTQEVNGPRQFIEFTYLKYTSKGLNSLMLQSDVEQELLN